MAFLRFVRILYVHRTPDDVLSLQSAGSLGGQCARAAARSQRQTPCAALRLRALRSHARTAPPRRKGAALLFAGGAWQRAARRRARCVRRRSLLRTRLSAPSSIRGSASRGGTSGAQTLGARVAREPRTHCTGRQRAALSNQGRQRGPKTELRAPLEVPRNDCAWPLSGRVGPKCSVVIAELWITAYT